MVTLLKRFKENLGFVPLFSFILIACFTSGVIAGGTAHEPPQHLRLNFGDGTLIAKWSAPLGASFPTSYTIEYQQDGQTVVTTTPAGTTTRTFTGLQNGNLYQLYIQANYLSGSSVKLPFTPLAPLAPKRFTGAVNNKWSEAGNWEGNTTPTSEDIVLLSAGTVFVDTNASVAGITTEGTNEATLRCEATGEGATPRFLLRTGFTRGQLLLTVVSDVAAPCALEFALQHPSAGRGTSGRIRFPSSSASSSWKVFSSPRVSAPGQNPSLPSLVVDDGDSLLFTGGGSVSEITLSGLVEGAGSISAEALTPLRLSSPFFFQGTVEHTNAGSSSLSGLGLLRSSQNDSPEIEVHRLSLRSSPLQVGSGAQASLTFLSLDSLTTVSSSINSAMALFPESSLRAQWVNSTRGSLSLSRNSTLWLGDMPRRPHEYSDVTIPVKGDDPTAQVYLTGTIGFRGILSFSGLGRVSVPVGSTCTLDVYPPTTTSSTTARTRMEVSGWSFLLPYNSTLFIGSQASHAVALESLNHRLPENREVWLQGAGRMEFLGRVEVVGSVTARIPVPHAPAPPTFPSPSAMLYIGEGSVGSIYNSQSLGTQPTFAARVTGPGTFALHPFTSNDKPSVRWAGPQIEPGPARVYVQSGTFSIAKRLSSPLPLLEAPRDSLHLLPFGSDFPSTIPEYGPEVLDTAPPSGRVELQHVRVSPGSLLIASQAQAIVHLLEFTSSSTTLYFNFEGSYATVRVARFLYIGTSGKIASSSAREGNVVEPPLDVSIDASWGPTYGDIHFWTDTILPSPIGTFFYARMKVLPQVTLTLGPTYSFAHGMSFTVAENATLRIPEGTSTTWKVAASSSVLVQGTVRIEDASSFTITNEAPYTQFTRFTSTSTLELGLGSTFSFTKMELFGAVQYDTSPGVPLPTMTCAGACSVLIDGSEYTGTPIDEPLRLPVLSLPITSAALQIRGSRPVLLPTGSSMPSNASITVLGNPRPGTLLLESCDRLIAFSGAGGRLLLVGTVGASCRTTGTGEVLVPIGAETIITANPAQLTTLTVPANATLTLRTSSSISPVLVVVGTLLVPSGFDPVLTSSLTLLPTATLRIEPGASCTLRGGGILQGEVDVGAEEDGTGAAAAAAAAAGVSSLGVLRVHSSSVSVVTNTSVEGVHKPYFTLGSVQLINAQLRITGQRSLSLLLPLLFDPVTTSSQTSSTFTLALDPTSSPRFLYRGCSGVGALIADSTTVPVEFIAGEQEAGSRCNVQGSGILSYPPSSTARFLGPMLSATHLRVEQGAILSVSAAEELPIPGVSHNFSISHPSAVVTVHGKLYLLRGTSVHFSAATVVFSPSSTVELEENARLELSQASGLDAGSSTAPRVSLSGQVLVDSSSLSTGIILRHGGVLHSRLVNPLPLLSVHGGTLRVSRAGSRIYLLQLLGSAALEISTPGPAFLALSSSSLLQNSLVSVDWAQEEANPDSGVLFVSTLETPPSSAPRVTLLLPNTALVVSRFTSSFSPRFLAQSSSARLVLRETDTAASLSVLLPASGITLEGSGVLEVASGTILHTQDVLPSSPSTPNIVQNIPLGWTLELSPSSVLRTGSFPPPPDAIPAPTGVPVLTVQGPGIMNVNGLVTVSKLGGDMLFTLRTVFLPGASLDLQATRRLTLTPPPSFVSSSPPIFNITLGAELILDGMLSVSAPSSFLLQQPATIRGLGSLECNGKAFPPTSMRGDGYLDNCIGPPATNCSFSDTEFVVRVSSYFSALPRHCVSSSPLYFIIAPALPPGLSLDTQSGEVHGMVQEVFPLQTYTLTAGNDRGLGESFPLTLRFTLYECPAGFYCPSATVQVPCPLGSYCPKDTSGPHPCSLETPGIWCPAGSSAPLPCPAAFFCSDPSTRTECSPGTYCPERSVSESPCSAGYVCVTPASEVMCAKGSYCPQNSTAEIACPGGSFCPDPSLQRSCTLGHACPPGVWEPVPCLLGSFCPPGATSVLPCTGGYFCPDVTTMLPCPAGSYCPVRSSSSTLCGTGTYCPERSVVETPCPAGFVCATPASPPLSCRAGTYCPEGSPTELPCPARPGVYCPPQSSEYECPAGFFCPASDGTVRVACEEGSYCPRGSAAATPCPRGQICSRNAMSTSPCPSGYYCPGSTVTVTGTPCGYGHACPEGSAEPTPCSPGSYSAVVIGANCTACERGRANAESGARGCTTCVPGTFAELEGSQECVSCGDGYTGPAGAVSPEQCREKQVPFLDTIIGQITISFLSILGSILLKAALMWLELRRNAETWKREPGLRVHDIVRQRLKLKVETVSVAGDNSVQFVPIINNIIREIMAVHPVVRKMDDSKQDSSTNTTSLMGSRGREEEGHLLSRNFSIFAELEVFAELSDEECERLADAISRAFLDVSSYGNPWPCCKPRKRAVHFEPWYLIPALNLPNLILLFVSYVFDRVGVCKALPEITENAIKYHKSSPAGVLVYLPPTSPRPSTLPLRVSLPSDSPLSPGNPQSPVSPLSTSSDSRVLLVPSSFSSSSSPTVPSASSPTGVELTHIQPIIANPAPSVMRAHHVGRPLPRRPEAPNPN